ncbi:lipoate--protein ligase [Candidatus Phytoplasma melaleucae]|uniref:lipoate--protein ligase n=1 Tax=Candidatus Phytoplasma melaleucae TaxID=2982630 RepID=A0ABT9DCR6_9MOLU|nr:lipoate--protein ligase ['Melaleuca sp.' phytoplasma]MDO8167909.1 lipoate--protein ligase ['Melaleuca sp.' phytoplasma]
MILIKYSKLSNLKPYFYYGLERYILNNVVKHDNEVYFFLWQMKGIVLGRNQIIENEINLDFVKKNKIDFFRRPTGGGCVYNDINTPIFSIIAKKKDPNFHFKQYLKQIIKAFQCLGVNLYFSGRNDMLLEGKKVSGSAFLQNKNGVIIHGTLLYNCDIEIMIRCITPNNEKLISKGINSVVSRVANLKDYLNEMTQEELIHHLEKYLTTREYLLSKEEIERIKQISQEYSSKEWLYFKHPPYSKILKHRFPWGDIELSLSLENGKIQKLLLAGDFFGKEDNLSEFTNYFVNIPYTSESLKKILRVINIQDYILNACNEDFLFLFKKGILHS